jgi:hypothetical protein
MVLVLLYEGHADIFILQKPICCKAHNVKLQSQPKASQLSLFSAWPHLPIEVQTEPSH